MRGSGEGQRRDRGGTGEGPAGAWADSGCMGACGPGFSKLTLFPGPGRGHGALSPRSWGEGRGHRKQLTGLLLGRREGGDGERQSSCPSSLGPADCVGLEPSDSGGSPGARAVGSGSGNSRSAPGRPGKACVAMWRTAWGPASGVRRPAEAGVISSRVRSSPRPRRRTPPGEAVQVRQRDAPAGG